MADAVAIYADRIQLHRLARRMGTTVDRLAEWPADLVDRLLIIDQERQPK